MFEDFCDIAGRMSSTLETWETEEFKLLSTSNVP